MKRTYKDILAYFDFSSLKIEILEILDTDRKALTIKEINSKLDSRGKNLYRPIKFLLEQGLITELDTYPASYRVKDLQSILKRRLEEAVQEITNLQKERGIVGRRRVLYRPIIRSFESRDEYKRYGRARMPKVSRTLRIVASGSEQNSEFWKTHLDIIKRKGKVWFIVNNLNTSELKRFENWERSGILLRRKYLAGLNLVIYDEDTFQLGARQNKNTRDKFGIASNDKILVLFFIRYFDILWESAERIQF
ncbi:MAG: hypothetical protein ABIE03_07725 [Patescibacteria group bacterium]|nr:hypothetical protein [Patescibacteria group bacterium]